MIVKNSINLIGDALGTFPVLQQMAKDNKSFSVIVDDEIKWLYELVPDIKLCKCHSFDKELNLSGAFTMSHQHGIYMTQAHYPFMGYPIPEEPVKANLTVKNIDVAIYDYIIAPFGRSAPIEQKWQLYKWKQLIEMMPEYKFCIIGNRKYDNWIFDNCDVKYDLSAQELCNILLKSKYGCISIVTGISHLCYHLGVKNYLLANQSMTWGLNPDSIIIDDNIPNLEPQKIHDILCKER